MPDSFQADVRHDDAGHATVAVSGDIDLRTADELNDCLQGCGDRNVTVDLAGATFLDSYGMYVLVSNATRLQAAGYHLVVRGQSRLIQRSLEIAGLVSYLCEPG
jgi:anti-anti-sigma factor